ncbi:MAG TPA: acetate--CoA ligase family protein [Steroidobacteraceae bacterium]|nr:acetate--CoA ligase family protein [Steroidobacteraceae bacterium]
MTPEALQRLLAPRSIALIGGAWADAAAAAARTIGYTGALWRVHPTRAAAAGATYYRSVDELPGAPDAAFLAAPAREIPGIAAALERRGAGGFVCFASGFSETGSPEGARLTEELLSAAGDLPFFGPNCYGFINFLDSAALWPDQVVGPPVERGVALICQSGTIALSLQFNARSLPLGYVITVGNQSRLAVEDMIDLLSSDARVSAFGLYVEGINDTVRFAAAVARARAAGKAIAAVKAGRTPAAARTAHSHTGALVGADAAFDAFCRQTGIARCESLATLCETLKVLHVGGPLPARRVLIMGASGGDMAMTADAARHLELEFAPLPAATVKQLRDVLGERVTISNPFDFHTHIWFDRPALHATFAAVQRAGFDAVGFMLDCPPAPADTSAYFGAIEEFVSAAQGAPSRCALICSLPESMRAETRQSCLAAGVIPLQGQREALEALAGAAAIGAAWTEQRHVELRIARRPVSESCAEADSVHTLTEYEGKAALAAYGIRIPRGRLAAPADVAALATEIGFPVVIKAVGATLEHKSEVGGVVLNVRDAKEAVAAAARLAVLSDTLLVEEMISDGVAEMLIGVSADPQFGQLLVLGAGGVLTELLRDSVTLLPPFTPASIEAALGQLKVAELLRGYRGKPGGDVAALISTALACARYAEAHVTTLVELDINPVIVRPSGRGVVAVDALVRLTAGEH